MVHSSHSRGRPCAEPDGGLPVGELARWLASSSTLLPGVGSPVAHWGRVSLPLW